MVGGTRDIGTRISGRGMRKDTKMQINKERKTQKDKDTEAKTQRHLPFNLILKGLRAFIQNIQ